MTNDDLRNMSLAGWWRAAMTGTVEQMKQAQREYQRRVREGNY